MPFKSQAKDRIKRALDQIPELMQMDSHLQEFIKWKRSAQIAITSTFGENSGHRREFDRISFALFLLEANFFRRAYEEGLTRAKATLESMLEEIDEYWPDDGLSPFPANGSSVSQETITKQVFVVHGRDERTKNI